ncbi:MAG TPA: glycosyltransferase family 4 protein [Gammaproteobacteria bacterium]|nr:glycosyltransferase family 4 protein [Gammaproteobacteria bacterium]
MRVLALTRYDRQAGSSRLRTLQYLPFWQASGIEVDFSCLLDKHYLAALYGKRQINKFHIIKAYLRRIKQLLQAKKYKFLWIEKELFPWMPALAEKILHRLNIPYVVDYDDAVFHYYDLHRQPLIRSMLGKKIDQVMHHARLVVAGNEYLANRAKTAGAKEIAIIPTVIDITRYALPVATEDSTDLIIGWIGAPTTFRLLQTLAPVLAKVLPKYNAKLLVVGAKGEGFADLPVEWLDWSEDSEVEAIQRMSIGIMPLRDVPFDHGKCGYKLIQYMACSKPVVASPVGVNSQIVQEGKNGFLAQTEEQWQEALERLLRDAGLRDAMGRQGRLLVEQKYCLQVTAPVMIDLFQKTFK